MPTYGRYSILSLTPPPVSSISPSSAGTSTVNGSGKIINGGGSSNTYAKKIFEKLR
jgi:hypothetical protein